MLASFFLKKRENKRLDKQLTCICVKYLWKDVTLAVSLQEGITLVAYRKRNWEARARALSNKDNYIFSLYILLTF